MKTATKVKERPILFNGDMVKALLDGSKTQTRRPVKLNQFAPSDISGYDWRFRNDRGLWDDVKLSKLLELCPYGDVFDRLWVRETFAYVSPHEDPVPYAECNIEYRADNPNAKYPAGWDDVPPDWFDELTPKWKPSIHMPRRASRVTLEITKLRIERVQDITEQDAQAEGMHKEFRMVLAAPDGSPDYSIPASYKGGFVNTWENIYQDKREYGWVKNPWVWVVEFKRVGA